MCLRRAVKCKEEEILVHNINLFNNKRMMKKNVLKNRVTPASDQSVAGGEVPGT